MAEQIATHIVRDPQIRFGKPTICGSRIAVHDVVIWTRQGQTPEMIANDFPLALGQIHAALAYYYDHKYEIDRELRENAEEFDRLAAEAPTAHLTKRIQELMKQEQAQERNE